MYLVALIPVCLDVPDSDGLVVAAGDDSAAVELDAADAARVALERPHVALPRQPATPQLVTLPARYRLTHQNGKNLPLT